MALTYVGQSIPRRDGREKVTGQAHYTAGMEVPGMVHGRALRSPVPHAHVVRIDASEAEKVPGVICVLTRADIAAWGIHPFFGSLVQDQPIVAVDRVRFVGDVVAAVAAETEEAAAAALDLIAVEYDELPVVPDTAAALAPDAPALHPAGGGAFTGDTSGVVQPDIRNVAGYFRVRKGDIRRGWAESDRVFEHEFTLPPMSHAALEPFAAVAGWTTDGGIDCWSATQTPSSVRQTLSDTFQVPFSKVRVRVPLLGGGFGGKCYAKIEPLAVALARKARRPVRLVLTREESFLTNTRHGCRIKVKTGVRADGTLVARQMELFYDAGAYADVSPRVGKNGAYPGPGPYRIPHVWVDSYAVYTNKAPAGAFRGYGTAQACWAAESQLDIIARELGLDPLDLRLKNAWREGIDVTHTGQLVAGMPVHDVLEKATAAVGWRPGDGGLGRWGQAGRTPDGKLRGRGLAVSIKGSSPSVSNATVKMNEDGSLEVMVATVEIGQGSETALAQIAAEAMQIPIEQVHIVRPDTAVTPYDRSTSSSRSVYMMGNAILDAIGEIRSQLLAAASDLLEVAAADLELSGGAVAVKGHGERRLAYGDVIRRRFGARVGNLTGRGLCETRGGLRAEDGQGLASHFWETSATACVVEVDPDTGRVEILDLAVAADVGRMVNPVLCVGQIEGATMQGLGGALTEEMIFAAGQPVNPNFLDYGLPTVVEAPRRFQVVMLEYPAPGGPYGAHGVGETSILAAAPAVANAIADATGGRVCHLPMTPEKVLRAIRCE